MQNEIEKLKTRWNTREGSWTLSQIFEALHKKKPLSSLKDVSLFQDRYDLRGIDIHKLQRPLIRLGPWALVMIENPVDIKGITLVDADLSYSNFSGTIWISVSLKNVLSESSDWCESPIERSSIHNSEFYETDFSMSYWGGESPKSEVTFEDVSFAGCNFKGMLCQRCVFRRCLFKDCNFEKVFFQGCSFIETKFEGDVIEAIFSGVVRSGHRSKWKQSGIMKDVDFSKANLKHTDFCDKIDITLCKFPESEDYLIIKSPYEIYRRVYELVKAKWEGEERAGTLRYLELALYNEKKRGQPLDILDKHGYVESWGKDSADKYFQIIHEAINERDNKREE